MAVKASAKALKKALDMSKAARMKRARGMGFDEKTYYKGMYPYDWTKEVQEGAGFDAKIVDPGPEITEINRRTPFPSFGGSDGDVEGIAGFLTTDPKVASRFAGQQGAVYPLKYKKGRELVIDANGKNAGDVQFREQGKDFRDAIRSGDYDTITIANTADEGDVTVALNPSNIRSVNAAFDPAKADSPNLLASAAPLAVGAGLLGQSGESEAGPLNQVPRAVNAIGEMARDIRFDPRKLEQDRLNKLTTTTEERPIHADTVKLSQFEGQPFITTMADRTRAGAHLTGINDVDFNFPVNLQGGQDYMFENPGQVWASAPNVVKQMKRAAEQAKSDFGADPLYVPWRMAPTGSDFSKMTGETMIQFASANMNKRNKRSLDSKLKKAIPNWPGVDSPDSTFYWRSAPDKVRKSVKNMMDKEFRDRGGLSVGEARLSIADPSQLDAREGGIQSIGRVAVDSPVIMDSGHPSYPAGLPGEGIGRVDQDIGIFELLGQGDRTIPDLLNPGQTDIRALQMKPYTGVIDETVLKRLQARGVDVGNIDPALLGTMAAGSLGGAAVANQGGVMPTLNKYAGHALEAIDKPLSGLLGLSRIPAGLLAGESFDEAMNAAANQVRQGSDRTLYDIGGVVTDRTGNPYLGTAAYAIPSMLSPF